MSGSKTYATFTQWNTAQQKVGAPTLRDSKDGTGEHCSIHGTSQAVKDKYHMISPTSGT